MDKARKSHRSGAFFIRPVFRIALALCVAIIALWVGAVSFGYAVRRANLPLASSLAGNDSSVLSLRARALLGAGKLREAARVATSAFEKDPTSVSAIATIGVIEQTSGNAAKARKLLQFAERLSRRDFQVHLWAIETAVVRNDINEALRHYDLALRTTTQAQDILFPILGNTLSDSEISPKLLNRLKDRPIWYESFLSFVAEDQRVSPSTAIRFLLAAHGADLNAAPSSLVVLVARSIDAQQPGVAWLAYTLKRPDANRRQVRDSHFLSLPDMPASFDWTLSNEGGVVAGLEKSREGVGELNVIVGAGAAGVIAEQLQFLPQGAYKLSLSATQVQLRGGELVWNISCADGSQLTRLPLPANRAGSSVSASFRVSESCSTQWLRLTASPTDAIEGLQARVARVELLPSAKSD